MDRSWHKVRHRETFCEDLIIFEICRLIKRIYGQTDGHHFIGSESDSKVISIIDMHGVDLVSFGVLQPATRALTHYVVWGTIMCYSFNGSESSTMVCIAVTYLYLSTTEI